MHCIGLCGHRRHYRTLLLTIEGHQTARDIARLRIQIKHKFNLWRQIAVNLLAILFRDRKDLLKLRQHRIIKICKLPPPDLKRNLPASYPFEKRTDFINAPAVRPTERILFHIAGFFNSDIKFRHIAAYFNPMKL